MSRFKGLTVAVLAFTAALSSTVASALEEERLLPATNALVQAGHEIRVDGRREAVRRGEVEVDGTVTRPGRDLRISTGRSVVRILASPRLPVVYRGRTYRTTDLEKGDRIRVIGRAGRNGIEARWIGVISNVSDRRHGRRDDRQDVMHGRITRIDHRRETLRLRTESGRTITVDVRDAVRRGRSDVRFDRLREGDRISVFGGFADSQVFRADSIQIARGPRGRDDREEWREGRGRY